MKLATILGLWFVVSILFSLFLGRLFYVGRGQ